jgi:hypothetical protein
VTLGGVGSYIVRLWFELPIVELGVVEPGT